MIYIYPNGYYTKKLISMLKEFEFEFTAIDDSDPKTSLISMTKKYKK
ncbi:hypothetical protein [Campylobacter fetus]|nr:hypothetical protein [Campylobacter fetus]